MTQDSSKIPPRCGAKRINDIQPFRVVEVLTRAKQLESLGRDIVHMQAGEPDFATAEPIIEAGVAALRNGATHYSDACGIQPLREAIAEYYRQDYGVDVAPERIMVTPGASGALLLIASLLINPGDSVLMTDPGYPCNRHFMRLVEGEGQLVAVDAADRYQLTAASAEAAWRDNTVGAMVASPANPTGEILDAGQLTDLYKLVASRGGHLIVDEIYHGLTYHDAADSRFAGQRPQTALALGDKVVVINSFSKYFGMTGWRLGWMVVPEHYIPVVERLAQNLFLAPTTPSQYAALAAFDELRLGAFKQRVISAFSSM